MTFAATVSLRSHNLNPECETLRESCDCPLIEVEGYEVEGYEVEGYEVEGYEVEGYEVQGYSEVDTFSVFN
ncbi:predicted protein [Sclerotinia sclerotiorum 1980 UF-70]|uniref:Uncharacterized protein n=1 Tax=Sclerotinia sclerotiorum (strain ATCC 18683 / 1980 / Ss-1) TaxID=665079 RepID=A7F226_SCLS1|nr:predicted protein [Sclerotinia sclerotiorum 1980 UF-70]EDN95768.1 predicted protein [Sclerotinia sclerotiorum 1980 UF-70]